MSARLSPVWLPTKVLGLLIAMLALVSQLALGAVVLPDEVSARDQSITTLDAITILCDSAVPTAPDQLPTQHRHNPDHALCPVSTALAMPAAVLGSGPELPAPSSNLAERAAVPPPVRAPPAQPRQTPPSRAPPVLS